MNWVEGQAPATQRTKQWGKEREAARRESEAAWLESTSS